MGGGGTLDLALYYRKNCEIELQFLCITRVFLSPLTLYILLKKLVKLYFTIICMSDYHIQAHFEPKRKVYMKWILKNSLFYYESFQNFKSTLF